MRIQLVAVAAGLMSAVNAHAVILYDSLTPIGTTGQSSFYNGGVPDTFIGGSYTLPGNVADLTGLDLCIANVTTTNYNGILAHVYIWGTVNPLTGSSTSPAFGNFLGEESIVLIYNSSAGGYSYFGSGGAGKVGPTPTFQFSSPLALNGSNGSSTTIGLAFNYQGTTDPINNTNYQNANYSSVQLLTSIITDGAAPTNGSNPSTTYFRNAAGETNGNFQLSSQRIISATSTYTNVATRIFGDVVSTTPDQWLNASDGSWEDGTRWSNTTPPGGGADAIFNLSSGGYTVQLTGAEIANNVYIQNDKVTFDLNAVASDLSIVRVLSVGQQSTGSLTLANSGGQDLAIVQPGSIVVGSNGGTGTLTVTNGVYLFTNGDTAIGAGSSLAVGAFAKLGTSTLTIAGTTNAWTGQLDIGNTSLDVFNGSIGTITNQLKSGLGNGSWTGQGIVSSNAHADTSHLTAVGAILNNNGSGGKIYGSGTALGLFDGDNPATTSVLLRYTYFGDTNLDGQVDGSDYSRIDNGFLLALTGWYNGDFNYDGSVNGSDYTLIDNAFNQQGPNLVTNPAATPSLFGAGGVTAEEVAAFNRERDLATFSGSSTGVPLTLDPAVSISAQIAGTSVPEPASMGLLITAAAATLGRRSRRRSSKPV